VPWGQILPNRIMTAPLSEGGGDKMRAAMLGVVGRFIDLRSLHGNLGLSWHTDQLHPGGARLRPILDRGRMATLLAMLRRNGTVSVGRKRGL
jgi:hypothetical protein